MPLELLLQSQKNEVFEAVVRAGFNPAQFSWEEWASPNNDDLVVSVLNHTASEDYWFFFDRDRRGHVAVFAPGESTHRQTQVPGSWPGQIGYVGTWLRYLRREREAPDLWSATTTPVGADASNEPFSPTELQAIGERLALIERHISEVRALQVGEAKYVHEALGYLLTNAEHEGRRNWINMAVGVIFGVVTFLALPPEAAGALFKFAVGHVQAFGMALQGAISTGTAAAPPLPMPGPPPAPR